MVIWLIIIGAAAGFLATRIMHVRMGVVETVLLGMAGAVIGGLVLRVLITVTGALAGLVGAVLGAVLLIWLWQTYVRRK
ncbi:GlsB/YeaQ/YmgE family stress response membrane protein [Aestuariicoccus sp. MJ-SS9]|uniref:GlsB/YeaQ/YmgE family stress response membrane protein n=1 Tax=Aestuariicoccus sp. MJ-SS9 TaxID=3079855 RepID=UPI00290D9A4E|nr:GlsB/YeaQ/YmgE family stress response membrane protein [Aestuariicoccus sp. MJ-SS9]MDU8912744.1 GlsB/YeaQ/YmgE family stress response membrane protein [Aestuariicoccus sp. MJ-SS9]